MSKRKINLKLSSAHRIIFSLNSQERSNKTLLTKINRVSSAPGKTWLINNQIPREHETDLRWARSLIGEHSRT